MSIIPLHIQRRFEQRWALRFGSLIAVQAGLIACGGLFLAWRGDVRGWRFLSSAEGLRCSVDGFSRQPGSMGLAVSMVFFSSDEPECCGAGRALRALDRARAGIQFPRSTSDHFAAR